jgi:hypothetical protein
LSHRTFHLCEGGEKAALADVRAWRAPDRPIDEGTRDGIGKHIAVFVFANEFCDFEEMLAEFGWLSAFALGTETHSRTKKSSSRNWWRMRIKDFAEPAHKCRDRDLSSRNSSE